MISRLARIGLLASLVVCTSLSQDKSTFDIEGKPAGIRSALGKTDGFGIPGWTLVKEFGELSLMPGGYFTFGSNNGSSSSGLDDHCGILFGHPFAKTSYPLFCIDGVWNKADAFFGPDSFQVNVGSDSVVLLYRKDGLLQFGLSLGFQDNGKVLRLSSRLKNLDTVQHSLGLAFVADPALGKWGDGQLAIAGHPMVRDTIVTDEAILSNVIEFRERQGLYPGMRIGLEFPEGLPSSLIAANWADAVATPAPTYTPSPLRSLYDLIVEMVWQPAIVQPQAETGATFLLRQLTPDFGSKVFLRWDLPDHATIHDGVMYPVALPTMASATVTGGGLSGSLEVTGGQGIVGGTGSASVALAAGTTTFTSRALTINEVYQPAIVPLALAYREGGIVRDSLIRPIYIPATPVSDTGLSVSIDSIISSTPSKVQVIFQTRRTATGALISGLTPQNVWVYDNGARINDISVGPDTTGARKVDVVFVLDVTGSMSNEIDDVKNNIEEFADSMQAHAQAFRLGMVTFLDNIENVYALTPDVAAFKQNVAVQNAHGGDDLPENSLDALYRASEMPFAEGAQRLIIWITDAPYHEKDSFTSRSRQDVISRLLLTDMTVYCIGAPEDQTDWYDPIVNATGGMYYSIIGNFRDIMLDISRHQMSGKSVVSFHPLSATTHTMTLWVHYGGLGGSDTLTIGPTGSVLASSGLQCYPNPFNPTTVLSAQWSAASEVQLLVFNLLGQKVATVANGRYPGGHHTFTFDARGLGSGTYFVRLEVRSPEGRIIARDVTKILHLK